MPDLQSELHRVLPLLPTFDDGDEGPTAPLIIDGHTPTARGNKTERLLQWLVDHPGTITTKAYSDVIATGITTRSSVYAFFDQLKKRGFIEKRDGRFYRTGIEYVAGHRSKAPRHKPAKRVAVRANKVEKEQKALPAAKPAAQPIAVDLDIKQFVQTLPLPKARELYNELDHYFHPQQ